MPYTSNDPVKQSANVEGKIIEIVLNKRAYDYITINFFFITEKLF